MEAEIENVRFKADVIVDKTLLKPLGNDGQRKSAGNVGINRQSKGTGAKPTVTFSFEKAKSQKSLDSQYSGSRKKMKSKVQSALGKVAPSQS